MEERGFEITYLDVDEQGFIKPEKLLQALRKDTILVSIMTANNEIGTIQAIPELASLVKANSRAIFQDRKSTRLNSSHYQQSRMPSSA